MKGLLLAILCCCQIAVGRADDDRIRIEATINGKAAHFIFDTGSPGYYILFRSGAERLGIAVTNYPPAQGESNGWWAGYTEACSLKLGDDSVKTAFWIIDSPPATEGIDADGLIGWPSVTNAVVVIDAEAKKMELLDKVPVDTAGWVKLPAQSGAEYLRLEVPKPNGKKSVILIDTGSTLGIKLRPDLWREWKSSHTNQPMALAVNFMWGPGIIVSEEMWAKKIAFGPLTLTDVPVTEASSVDLGIGGVDYDATLGFAVLKRLDLIVDPINGVAYLRPKSEKPPQYQHNRTGAVFLPSDQNGTEWIARVLKNGPAYAAGIRDGDFLLTVDGRKIQSWHDYINIGKWVKEQPAGTKISLTLKRGSKVFAASIVLKDILGP